MTSYLTNVLEGVVDIGQVKQWISEGSGLPPATSVATSPRSPTSSDQPQLTVDQFRVLLLNLVKEEADIIFLAAEHQALNSHWQLSASENVMRDAKTCHANSHSSRPPGLLNESNFPTLSIVPTKKEALDKRLSLRQHPDSAGALTSATAAQKNRGRKIAPTLVQLETTANGFPTLSSQAFASPQPQLLAEASAKDLCTSNRESGGGVQRLDLEAAAIPRRDASPVPAAAWQSTLRTPSSAGSTTTQGAPANRRVYADANVHALRSSTSPAASHFSTHSAPPALTPAKHRGKPQRISPSPLGESSSVGQSAMPLSHASAWPSPTANTSPSPSPPPTTSTSATSAWHNRSGNQPAASSAGPSRMSASRGSTAAELTGCQPTRGTAWSQPGPPLSSAATPNRPARSSPGPQSYRSSWQNKTPQAPWGSQSVASPDSTAISKLQPNRQEPQTPLSQVKSASGSTGTEYATPPSTLRPWHDVGADSSPPEGRTSTPQSQRLSTRFAAAAEITPASAHTPLPMASDNGKRDSWLCSLPATATQGTSQPTACGPDADMLTCAAQLDLLAAQHPGQVQHDQLQPAAPVLSDETVRLAELHAHIIAVVSSVSLAAELDLLLHLIALPPGTTCHPSQHTLHTQQPRFTSGAVAALYAAQVLSLSGRLVSSLGKPLLECLADMPLLQDHSQAFIASVHQELEVDDRMSLTPVARQYNSAGASSSQLFGAGAFTQDGQRQRSQEEQRKVSNMNDCRDTWAELMRTAAQQQAGQLKPFVSSHSQPSSTDLAGRSAAVLLYMQQHVRKPLRLLRHDNYATFAEIFTTALLQAAATGESLQLATQQSESEQVLQKQADKDASKMFRLNQRMQGQTVGHRPAHQGRYSTNSGGVRSGGSSPFQSPGMPTQQGTAAQPQFGFQPQLGRPHGRRAGHQAALSETDLVDLALAQDFPQAQQPFLMFLQAADSHRLDTCLVRCMNARLQTMHQSSLQEAAASDRARSERLVSQCCLASFLSFLTFSVHAGSTANVASGCHSHFQPATDLNAALYAAAVANCLEWVVPWVVRYVRFASQDSDAQQSCCIQRVLQRLHSIQSCTALLPGTPQFGRAASCLRCVLDDHLEQSADIERTVGKADAAWLSALQDWNTAGLQGPVSDARYLHLCCPLLEQARQAIQASISAEHGRWDVKKAKLKGMRKITPSQPQGASPGVKGRVPPSVAAAAAAGQEDSGKESDGVKMRLQQAFLEQYSPTEAKVRLKDVMDYIIGIIAQNAVTASLESCVPHLLASAADDMAVQTKACLHKAALESPRQLDNRCTSSGLVSDRSRMCIATFAEEIVESAVTKAMEACFAAAEEYIESHSVRALLALATPVWTKAVVGTAAAMVVEAARSVCARQLIVEVPTAVRRQIQQQLDTASNTVIKAANANSKESNQALPCA